MFVRIFRSLRSWEKRKKYSPSLSIAYALFGFILPSLLVIAANAQFGKYYFRLSGEIVMTLILAISIICIFLLSKLDE